MEITSGPGVEVIKLYFKLNLLKHEFFINIKIQKKKAIFLLRTVDIVICPGYKF